MVELLTVIFIISLLIGILIPSLSSARSAAKKSKTASDLRALETALQMFKNDNERDFSQTNGCPPSFAHPPIKDYAFDSHLGQIPFMQDGSKPTVYGAHWLPAMLMGPDQLGYVKKSSLPPNLRSQPSEWYYPDEGAGRKMIPRASVYIEPGSVKTVPTQNVRGRKPANEDLFPNWEAMKLLPVMVDAFDQPILYYAANRFGRTSNMVEDIHDLNNQYTGGDQQEGPPYYFHQDNVGFTGSTMDEPGWDYGGGPHAIAESGADLTADQLMDPLHHETYARFVMDRALYRSFQTQIDENGQDPPAAAPLKPVNPDGYLLISAGVDGRYGTGDDVTNFPLSADFD